MGDPDGHAALRQLPAVGALLAEPDVAPLIVDLEESGDRHRLVTDLLASLRKCDGGLVSLETRALRIASRLAKQDVEVKTGESVAEDRTALDVRTISEGEVEWIGPAVERAFESIL